MSQDTIRNLNNRSLRTNMTYATNEVSRLGSVEQRNTTYRRNGMLNFGARQMFAPLGKFSFHIVGVGGPPVVGS